MHLGVDTFLEGTAGSHSGPASLAERQVQQMLEEVEVADRAGLYVFGIGEHHREEYLASAPVVLLAAAAARTRSIRLSSAVTVLSSEDPVRVFQQFATLDLVSGGRAEIIVGRGGFTESYALFGQKLEDAAELFREKLDLLLRLRESTAVYWQGHHRRPLTGQSVWPRPVQPLLPVRLGVGYTPASFERAGTLGLPLTVPLTGGKPEDLRPLVDLYRAAWSRAGHPSDALDVALHIVGFVAETDAEAADTYWPAYAQSFAQIGPERGWEHMDRTLYDRQRAPGGAFAIGSPAAVIEKLRTLDTLLGGLSRVTLMMMGGLVDHESLLRSIHLLGTAVAPAVATTSPHA